VGAGTSRIEVTPNAQGIFTFAIVHPTSNINPTTGNPLAWIDIPGGVSNRPDPSEPQARGENFAYNTGRFLTATLESLGCPPGTDQRGHPEGNNKFDDPDPCLGRDQSEDTADAPHVPWELNVAAESPSACTPTSSCPGQSGTGGANAATGDGPILAEDDVTLLPSTKDPSRGDIIFRFVLRDAAGRTLRDDPTTQPTNEGRFAVTFRVTTSGSGGTSVAPHRPNEGSSGAVTTPQENNTGIRIVDMVTVQGVAEIVVDRTVTDPRESTSGTGVEFNSATVEVLLESSSDLGVSCVAPATGDPEVVCRDTAQWAAVRSDTTANITPPTSGAVSDFAPPASCPSPTQPCFNGAVTAIDKARDYYMMNRGGSFGGQAYVVYAIGGGGEPYTSNAPVPPATQGTTPAPRPPFIGSQGTQVFSGERPSQNAAGTATVDQYFIDGLPAAADADDNLRCGFFANIVQSGCARFEAAMSFDDRMVYEFSGTGPTRTQTHFLTNGTAPV